MPAKLFFDNYKIIIIIFINYFGSLRALCKAFTAVLLEIPVFWDVILCFGGSDSPFWRTVVSTP